MSRRSAGETTWERRSSISGRRVHVGAGNFSSFFSPHVVYHSMWDSLKYKRFWYSHKNSRQASSPALPLLLTQTFRHHKFCILPWHSPAPPHLWKLITRGKIPCCEEHAWTATSDHLLVLYRCPHVKKKKESGWTELVTLHLCMYYY